MAKTKTESTTSAVEQKKEQKLGFFASIYNAIVNFIGKIKGAKKRKEEAESVRIFQEDKKSIGDIADGLEQEMATGKAHEATRGPAPKRNPQRYMTADEEAAEKAAAKEDADLTAGIQEAFAKEAAAEKAAKNEHHSNMQGLINEMPEAAAKMDKKQLLKNAAKNAKVDSSLIGGVFSEPSNVAKVKETTETGKGQTQGGRGL